MLTLTDGQSNQKKKNKDIQRGAPPRTPGFIALQPMACKKDKGGTFKAYRPCHWPSRRSSRFPAELYPPGGDKQYNEPEENRQEK